MSILAKKNSSSTFELNLASRLAPGAVLLLATLFNFVRLSRDGFGHPYCAATVKSMLVNWHNVFYAAFDPGGFVSVDKPPLGFWIQALSATIFGFSGWSLLLPQAVAGVLSVALLYRLVARVFGAWAGLTASLALTLTPILVATDRNNAIDSQVVLVLLLAAWAVSLAIERGQLRWLMACAALVGIGFNIKMLQAYMPLPAFWLTYAATARTRWTRRVVHLAAATLALVVVSFAWAEIVDLTPPAERPYVGSTVGNNEMELIFEQNGVTRLGEIASALDLPPVPRPFTRTPAQPQATPRLPSGPARPSVARPVFSGLGGSPGILRLFSQQFAGQISWFLPLALVGFLAAAARQRLRYPPTREQQQLLLWIAWLAPTALVFSFGA